MHAPIDDKRKIVYINQSKIDVPHDQSVHPAEGHLWHQCHHNVCRREVLLLPETEELGKCPFHCKRDTKEKTGLCCMFGFSVFALTGCLYL